MADRRSRRPTRGSRFPREEDVPTWLTSAEFCALESYSDAEWQYVVQRLLEAKSLFERGIPYPVDLLAQAVLRAHRNVGMGGYLESAEEEVDEAKYRHGAVGSLRVLDAWRIAGLVAELPSEVHEIIRDLPTRKMPAEARALIADSLFEDVDPSRLEPLMEYMREEFRRYDIVSSPLASYQPECPGPKTTWSFVEVDLSRPDEVIIQDFRAWLSQIRRSGRQAPRRDAYTPQHHAKWCDYKLVQITLLDFWAVQCGYARRPPPQLILDLFFAGRHDVDGERIRKVIRPYQFSWLSDATLSAMRVASNRRKNGE